MSDFSEIKKDLSIKKQLEREVNLKQLQINCLLTITQAINDNVSAEDLYKMYNSFLSWEMGVKKMALYINEEDKWICTSSIGISEELEKIDISNRLHKYNRLKKLEDDKDSLLFQEFDLIIPVLHKDVPITYAFIGGFDEEEDMYNKVRFITTITNIVAVAIENKRLFRRQVEQEKLKHEMGLASDMQQTMVPATLPKNADYELSSIYKPHLGVGGDYFDCIELGEGKFTFCVADISGKGLAAALLMANFQACFHTLITKKSDMDVFVMDLNEALFRITKGDRFLTFFVAEYDRKTNELTYVNSGHNPPVMAMGNKIYNLDKGSTILGSFEQLPTVEVGKIILDENAILLSFTDGLTDIQNDKSEYLQESLLYEFTLKHYELSTEEFNKQLEKYIVDFKGEGDYPDDLTVLTCKIYVS